MISTPLSCTSDYYSSSDFDYEDNDYDIVVKAAPLHSCSSIKETNFTLQTFAQQHRPSSNLSSTVKIQQSFQLLKLSQEYHLHNEVYIRANAILHQYLLLTCTSDITESILLACLSLSTKLSQHSNHSSIRAFQDELLISNENVICNALDWDIDLTTPINHIETILLHVLDYSVKQHLRELTYELIVLCLTDVRCVDLSDVPLGICCLLMASELLQCGELIPKEIFNFEQDKSALLETSLIYIRQVLMHILNQ
ncbi:hypothetical protein I4U23_028175 [Adineta vaga]|nr:hypothetical protein I4U23_028175 [Adineta vaga]